MQSVFNRVPSEIFREIILYTYSSKRNPNPDAPKNPNLTVLDFQVILPPMGASHVCRSWRRTLLSDPIMWTCLSVLHLPPRAIIELIPRSRQASLDVHLDLNCCLTTSDKLDEETLTMLSALFEEVHRFRSLHVRAREHGYHSPDQLRQLEKWTNHISTYLVERPAPKLQSFGLWTHKLPEGTTLFNVEAPRLEQFHYDLYDNLPPSRRFLCDTNLVKFDITLHAGIQLDRFLDLLELVSPTLKSLLIRGPCRLIDVSSPAGRRVTFPLLERLVIIGIVRHVAGAILLHISHPRSTKKHFGLQPPWLFFI